MKTSISICKDKATPVAKKVINKCFCSLMNKSDKGTYPFDTEPEKSAEQFIEDMIYEIRHDGSNMFVTDGSAKAILIDGGWSRPEQILEDYERICSKLSKVWVDKLKSVKPKTRSKK